MRFLVFILLATIVWTIPLPAIAVQQQANEGNILNIPDRVVAGVGYDQKLNAQVPLQLPLFDEAGKKVTLASFLGKRPLLLGLVYYGCPHLCKLEINGIIQSLQSVAFNVGAEFEVALVSFDPNDTPAIAAEKKKQMLRFYTHPKAEHGFHFLTAPESSIERLTQAVGFRYHYDEASMEYAHPAGIVILTPEGKISRYLYGIDYPTRDLRLALVEASQEKIGTPIDRFLLYCYHYDPTGGKYGIVIMNILRLVGAGVVLALGGGIFAMLWSERKKRKLVAAGVPS